jgi:tetratricopeptide (TPR) repeat protein
MFVHFFTHEQDRKRMSSRTNAMRIVTAGLSLTALLLSGCERKPDSGQATEGRPASAPTSQAAPAQAQFEVPRLSQAELAALGMALEMKMSSAYSIAREAPEDSSKLATLAAMYYVHGHPQQSVTCFRRVAELKPKDAASWFYLGMACEKAGQAAEARSAYEHALDLGPAYEPQLRRLGDVTAPSDPARAIEYYRRALALDPGDVLAWCGLSRAQIAQGQREDGLRSILIAANLEPYYADAQRAAAQALRDLGRAAQAEQYARLAEVGGAAAQAEDPVADSLLRAGLDARAVCADAMRVTERGDYERAKFMLEQIRAMRGAETIATEGLGAIAAAQKQWDEAASLFSEVLRADPQAFTAKSSLGEVRVQQGKLAGAERCLRDVLAEHPDHQATVKRFVNLMNRQKKPQEIVTVLEAAVAARPFDPVRRSLLSQYYAAAGRTDDALAELRKALELQPDYFPGHQQLGLLLCAQHKYVEAKAEFERALQTNPRYEDAYLYLSTALIQADKDMRGAEKVLRDGLKNVPNSHGLANSLAWILATSPDAGQRKPEEAVQLAERANAMTGSTLHNYLDTLGAAYAAAGRYEVATRLVQQAIEAARRVDAPQIEQYRARLALYEQNQPFRETE